LAQQKLGLTKDAVKSYSEAIRIRPDAQQAYANLGIIYQAAGDLEKAQGAYEHAAEIAPDRLEVVHNLAIVLDKQGAKEDAERLYVKLLAKNADLADVWFRLGYLRLERGDHRGSSEAFQSCIAKRADWPEAQLNLAISCWKMGDQEGAAKAFEAALAANPDWIDALRGLAALAVERKDFEQALDYQARLIEKGERSPELFYNTGLLFAQIGTNWTTPPGCIARLWMSGPSSPKPSSLGARAQKPGAAGAGQRLLEARRRAEARAGPNLFRQLGKPNSAYPKSWIEASKSAPSSRAIWTGLLPSNGRRLATMRGIRSCFAITPRQPPIRSWWRGAAGAWRAT